MLNITNYQVNVNQNTFPLGWLLAKRAGITNVGEASKKREYLHIVCGNVNRYSFMENSMVFSEIIGK